MLLENTIHLLFGLVLLELSLLLQTYIWQRKEYRLDRMRSFFTTPEYKQLWNPSILFFVLFSLLSWWMRLFEILAFISLGIYFTRLASKFGIFRPQWTKKATLLFVASNALMLVLALLIQTSMSFTILLSPVCVAIGVVFANSVANMQKGQVIEQARLLRTKNTNLKVVAVTGSVGKTSTKEYLHHILSKTNKTVVASKKHRNSEFSIAQDVLEQLTSNPNIYIVEAGAYKKGEIEAITSIVKPHIAIVTAITNQHEALFGSVEAIADAKWELIESLPRDGVAVLNADDSRIADKAKTFSGKAIYYSVTKDLDVYVENMRVLPEAIEGVLHIGSFAENATIPVVGIGGLQSVLAAVAASHALGVEPKDIIGAISSLPALPGTMQLRKSKNGTVVLDDSYSASEASIKNAVEHLATFPQAHKYIVVVPVIELSKTAEEVHKRIGSLLGGSNAEVFIYGKGYEKELREGAGSNADKVTWFTDAGHMRATLEKSVATDGVVLLEGRIPELVKNLFV